MTSAAPYVLDLSEETRHFEVAVFCYLNGRSEQGPGWHDRCSYSVDVERGHGRVTIYETSSEDKALGVAEYLEQRERTGRDPEGGFFTREGSPFDGTIWHWDHNQPTA